MSDDNQEELIGKILKRKAKGDPIKEWIIPLGSLLIAFLGILSAIYGQYLSSVTTFEAATISSKQIGYSKVLTSVDSAFDAKIGSDLKNLKLDDIRQAYYAIELLIPKEDRDPILKQIEAIILHIMQDVERGKDNTKYFILRANLRHSLQDSLANN